MNEKLSFFTNQFKVITQEEIKMEILSHFGRVKKLLGSSGVTPGTGSRRSCWELLARSTSLFDQGTPRQLLLLSGFGEPRSDLPIELETETPDTQESNPTAFLGITAIALHLSKCLRGVLQFPCGREGWRGSTGEAAQLHDRALSHLPKPPLTPD